MNPIVEALGLLTPFDIDIPKRRIGPRTDGGYVFADTITASQSVISYGISTEYRFDQIMAEAGHKVFMFDHTIEGINRTHDNMMWHREGVAGLSDASSSLYSIEDHLIRHHVEGDRLILKMDVEGAEFDAIGLASDETLNRFEQIVIEVHYLADLENVAFRARAIRMLRKLNQYFTLFHVHANNCDGPNGIRIVGGLPVTNLIELSYIKTAAVERFPSRTLYPTVFDYPNVPVKDKLLWFFPFMPTHLSMADFGLCENRIDLLATADLMARTQQAANATRLAVEGPAHAINIARDKPASQSSLSSFSTPDDAQGAVNGMVTGSFGFHTALEENPWWQVDLLAPTALQSVRVFNRIDACASRAYSFVVKLGDESGAFAQVHAQDGKPFGGKDGNPAQIDLAGAVARYVRIELPGHDFLHLDEVEVFASPAPI